MLVLNGSFSEFNRAKIEAITDQLRQLLGDPLLTVKRVDPGSIRLLIRSSPNGLEKARALFQRRSKMMILGHRVERIEWSSDIQSTATSDTIEVDRPKKSGKVIVVMPGKGGCGASTIAVNLAFAWKRNSNIRVLLLDLAMWTGEVSFMLRVNSKFSFLDALREVGALDQDLWGSMITPVNAVDVLVAPRSTPDSRHDLHDPTPILDYVRQIYDVIVVDAGGVYGEWNLSLAKEANELLLVTTEDLSALWRTREAAAYLNANLVLSNIRVIVNQHSPKASMSREHIGELLQSEILGTVPYDNKSVGDALAAGRPVSPHTAFGKSIAQLVKHLGRHPEALKQRISLSGLIPTPSES